MFNVARFRPRVRNLHAVPSPRFAPGSVLEVADQSDEKRKRVSDVIQGSTRPPPCATPRANRDEPGRSGCVGHTNKLLCASWFTRGRRPPNYSNTSF